MTATRKTEPPFVWVVMAQPEVNQKHFAEPEDYPLIAMSYRTEKAARAAMVRLTPEGKNPATWGGFSVSRRRNQDGFVLQD